MNKDEESVIFNFDFSINKPASLFVYKKCDKEIHKELHGWPTKLTNAALEQYEEAKVNIHHRELDSVKAKEMTTSETVIEHTKRSVALANEIISDMKKFIKENCDDEDCNVTVTSEGLSFMSKGDAGLNLAGYKFVFLAKVYENFNREKLSIRTYAPMTIKSTAGCAGKHKYDKKEPMIHAFSMTNIEDTSAEKFIKIFQEQLKRKKLMKSSGKTYIDMVDDICDSWWCYETYKKDIKKD